jgi:hypothetical protein
MCVCWAPFVSALERTRPSPAFAASPSDTLDSLRRPPVLKATFSLAAIAFVVRPPAMRQRTSHSRFDRDRFGSTLTPFALGSARIIPDDSIAHIVFDYCRTRQPKGSAIDSTLKVVDVPRGSQKRSGILTRCESVHTQHVVVIGHRADGGRTNVQ